MDVGIVGGGIVGLSAAHALAERGATVALYERGALGTGSTARSAGGIRSQFSTPVNVSLSRASKRVWNDFEGRFGVDIEYRKCGYLFLARSDATAERLHETVGMQRELGATSEYVDPIEATEYCPGLDPEPFVGATYGPDDGFADPNLAVQGYATAAREAGVEIRTGTTVTDLRRDGDRVVGLEVDGTERCNADYVVNAAGAWAGRIAQLAGIDLPIAPRRRQIAIVEPETPVPETVPLTIDLETGSYFRPERAGIALVGGHFGDADPDVDPDRFDDGMDVAWAATAVEHAADYTGYFGPETRIRRGWSGLYAVTPDHHPIVDETLPGLVTAAGFSGHGFQHAPATGRLVAELVLDGDASLVDVSALDGDRFDRGETATERHVA
ncbi:NAD(P)/FAD-dependent oxidoreductase [Halovivax cerinus]|uniref:NAD(P)/FAD-dependent oxidoreductase n=1 Tax=Halovivax cerinus TaxID=1487865 RepID=A0ABD5NKW1_9EURY|nr:FAD-dependent oxidoreductase [Halovivax cerinus]